VFVPTGLPRLPTPQALAAVESPLTLNWSQPGRIFRLVDRGDRARVYEFVLREGAAADVIRYVDGVLLVDLWDELVLPRAVRAAWSPLIEQVVGASEVVGGGLVTDDPGSLLAAFKIEVAQLFFSLPASDGFLLAGAGALLAQGLTARPTRDLDFSSPATSEHGTEVFRAHLRARRGARAVLGIGPVM
jgi:hypothetical protein